MLEMRDHCAPDPAGAGPMGAATLQLHPSARGYHWVRKLAHTIAVLPGAGRIAVAYSAEAPQYWPKEGGKRSMWDGVWARRRRAEGHWFGEVEHVADG